MDTSGTRTLAAEVASSPAASVDESALIIQLDKAEDPLSWHAGKKWLCTTIIVAMTTTISLCSSIHTAVVADVAQSFNCSRTVATLGVSTFLVGFAIGPLIFGPLSEVWGRNPIYRVVLLLFVAFTVGCALAPNMASLLVFRFFCGFFGSPTGRLHSSIVDPDPYIPSDKLGWKPDGHVAYQPQDSAAGPFHCGQFLGSRHSPSVWWLCSSVHPLEMVRQESGLRNEC